jgi:hypothetical protein
MGPEPDSLNGHEDSLPSGVKFLIEIRDGCCGCLDEIEHGEVVSTSFGCGWDRAALAVTADTSWIHCAVQSIFVTFKLSKGMSRSVTDGRITVGIKATKGTLIYHMRLWCCGLAKSDTATTKGFVPSNEKRLGIRPNTTIRAASLQNGKLALDGTGSQSKPSASASTPEGHIL